MAAATVTRRARWYILVSLGFLVAWQVAVVLGLPRRSVVALGLYGFVLHTLFGKALSLVPSYFDRQLAVGWAPAVQFPLTTFGAVGLAAAGLPDIDGWIRGLSGLSWFAGVVVFVGAIGWTIRDNPTGRETATSEANEGRRPVDRVANAFMPIAFGYLVLGSYETMGAGVGLPTLFDGYPPRATHLLAAGTAGLLLFAIGFRLLPRFLVAPPPAWLVRIVLPAGAIGPAIVAGTLPAGSGFAIGATVQAVAVIGFALAYLVLFLRSERRRVGFYAVLLGVIAGVAGVTIGMWFGIGHFDPALIRIHYRLNLLGFLGLSVIGVSYQFYPPGVATFPGGGDRSAFAAIGLLGTGLTLEVLGQIGGIAVVDTVGTWLALVGAGLHAALIVGLFSQRYG